MTTGAIVQNGYVVDDLDAAVDHWIRTTGIGPWTVFRGVVLDGEYRGETTTVTMDVAMGYSGELQVELMQITSSTPSPYADDDGTPLLGPHHVAWITDDLDVSIAAAERSGLSVLFRAGNEMTRVAYLESADQPGLVVEYIEGGMMRELIAAGVAAARHWDGTDPVRELG